MRTQGAKQRGHADLFTGKDHRELFLPYEAFESLVCIGFDGDPAVIADGQAALARDLRRPELPADFWGRLRTLSVIAVKMFYVADRLPEPAVLRTLADGCR
jgi:hypothetical protein